jgi:hypothetical protein
MSDAMQDTSLLFGVIPPSLCTPEQVATWDDGKVLHTYKLLRTPVNWGEIIQYGNAAMAIWRDNGTLTYIAPCNGDTHFPESNESKPSLWFYLNHLKLDITGNTEKDVAETAAFFLQLEEPTGQTSILDITGHTPDDFDFRAVDVQCLAHIFEVAPLRCVRFCCLTLSAEQSRVLATRPHAVELAFCGCLFDDHGDAFVDALLSRQSLFGSLEIEDNDLLSDNNLKRLLQADVLNYLGLPSLKNELLFLPLPARVDSLDYRMSSKSLMEDDFQHAFIAAKKLSLVIDHDGQQFPTEALISFLQRVAALGHFVSLRFLVIMPNRFIAIPVCIAHELIHATLANPNLEVLDLSFCNWDWEPHFEILFEGIKDHKQLCSLHLCARKPATSFGSDFCHLRKLLSVNRKIIVWDERENPFSDGSSIDALYELNRFYRGSAGLVAESPAERQLLLASALMENAADNLQCSALLLFDHLDVLFDLLQFAHLNELFGDNLRL